MRKLKGLILSAIVGLAAWLSVPAVVTTGIAAATLLHSSSAEASECTYYETLHPNFPLTGAHLSIGKCTSCAACHAGGTFVGTPKVCATCHDGSAKFSAVGRSPEHIPTASVNCDNCHNTTSFTEKWSMLHSAVAGQRCDSCHNGSFLNDYGAMGKDANHIITASDCVGCHAAVDKPTHTNADWFLTIAQIHQGITNGCVSCHDGIHATGKSNYAAGHPVTSDNCEQCHSINANFKCVSVYDLIREKAKRLAGIIA